jgi:hypothetical protein
MSNTALHYFRQHKSQTKVGNNIPVFPQSHTRICTEDIQKIANFLETKVVRKVPSHSKCKYTYRLSHWNLYNSISNGCSSHFYLHCKILHRQTVYWILRFQLL